MKSVWLALSLSILAASPALAQRGNYPPVIEGAEAMVYKQASDTDLQLWVFKPADWQPTDQRPAILFFFGGGWNGGSPNQFVPQSQYLAERGMVAFVVDYRVKSRHGTPAKECVADARDAMRFVRSRAKKLGIDPKRVAAGGGSAGGHIAACLGVIADDEPSKADALALFNPAVILAPIEGVEWPGRDRSAEMKERMGVDPVELSPYHHVSEGAPPTVIFHGTADSTVPYQSVELFTDKMQAAGATCILHGYEGAGHGFFNSNRQPEGDNPSALSQTLEQLDAFLVELGWLK